EAGKAQPVDASVSSDQGSRVAVTDECVILDVQCHRSILAPRLTTMTSRLGTLVILGAGGDLSSRLLLPGVGRVLDARDEAPFLLVGVGQQAMTDAEWQSRVAASFEAGGATGSQSERVRLDSVYLQEDVTDPAALQRILKRCEGVPALYFALPPSVTIAACTALEQVELPEGTVLALEKP